MNTQNQKITAIIKASDEAGHEYRILEYATFYDEKAPEHLEQHNETARGVSVDRISTDLFEILQSDHAEAADRLIVDGTERIL